MANRRHFSYIGYHGCEKELARRLILREVEMGKSANPYDWLGHGIYFWENDVFEENPKAYSGANHETLEQGRENYRKYAACDLRSVKFVRLPLPQELPENNDA